MPPTRGEMTYELTDNGLAFCCDIVRRSWVKVTENHHENRMRGIHFGSKHPLHHLLALFSSSRTRPVRRPA